MLNQDKSEESMFFKTFASPIALATATALALSSASFAQTMVGEIEISDDDLPAVTEHCEMLAENDMTTEGLATDDAPVDGEADDIAGDAAGVDADTVDGMSENDAVNDMTAEGSMAGGDAMAGETPTNDTMAGDVPTSGDDMAVDDTLLIDAITLDDCQAAGIIE